MKTLFFFLLVATITLTASGQAPQKMSYQAVVRNASNNLVINSAVGIKISILQGSSTGTAVYVETQTTTTNANGLAGIEIGGGTVVSGNFSTIDWANGIYFIKTETDPAGGTNYTITGTSQLLSVPYALHAKTAQTITGTISETDPVYTASPAKAITAANITNWTTAFNWGNHATQGYVKNTSATVAGNMMTYDGTNWVSKNLVLGSTGSFVPINNMQPYLVLNYCIALWGTFPSRSSDSPFLGEIELYGFNYTPVNFAPCNGQLLSISANTALFALLGTMYGGNGTTTFALPDLRGRAAINYGQGPGLSPRTIGEMGGAETTTILINNLPAHTHTVVYQ